MVIHFVYVLVGLPVSYRRKIKNKLKTQNFSFFFNRRTNSTFMIYFAITYSDKISRNVQFRAKSENKGETG